MKTKYVILIAAIALGIGYVAGRVSAKKEELTKLSIEQLNNMLDRLVKIEDYETAAVVRDIIKVKSV